MLDTIAAQHSHVLEFPEEEKMPGHADMPGWNKSSAFELMTGHPTQDPEWMLGFYYLVHFIHALGNTQCQFCCVRRVERTVWGGKSGDAPASAPSFQGALTAVGESTSFHPMLA